MDHGDLSIVGHVVYGSMRLDETNAVRPLPRMSVTRLTFEPQPICLINKKLLVRSVTLPTFQGHWVTSDDLDLELNLMISCRLFIIMVGK